MMSIALWTMKNVCSMIIFTLLALWNAQLCHVSGSTAFFSMAQCGCALSLLFMTWGKLSMLSRLVAVMTICLFWFLVVANDDYDLPRFADFAQAGLLSTMAHAAFWFALISTFSSDKVWKLVRQEIGCGISSFLTVMGICGPCILINALIYDNQHNHHTTDQMAIYALTQTFAALTIGGADFFIVNALMARLGLGILCGAMLSKQNNHKSTAQSRVPKAKPAVHPNAQWCEPTVNPNARLYKQAAPEQSTTAAPVIVHYHIYDDSETMANAKTTTTTAQGQSAARATSSKKKKRVVTAARAPPAVTRPVVVTATPRAPTTARPAVVTPPPSRRNNNNKKNNKTDAAQPERHRMQRALAQQQGVDDATLTRRRRTNVHGETQQEANARRAEQARKRQLAQKRAAAMARQR